MGSSLPAALVPSDEAAVVRRIAEGGSALVALSGGVDSGLVASLAHEALGATAVGVTVGGPAVSADELTRAAALARAVGLRHHVIAGDPLASADYRANGSDRCYHCRVVEGGALRDWGARHGVRQLLDGLHLDDLADDRPGRRAMDEAGFRHPLLVAGWGKATVRRIARARGLPNWDLPSNACLASRVERGEPITAELLARVEAAEAVLRRRGFRRIRVRVGAGAARIVVDPDEVARLAAEPTASQVLREVRALGFDGVTIDPGGYRTAGVPLPVVR